MILHLLLIGLACFALSTSTRAAENGVRDISPTPRTSTTTGVVPAKGDYWALVIGINKYRNVPKLETAVDDAVGISQVLVDRYGFRPERMLRLLDEQATRQNIERELYQLGQKAGEDDSVLIYYAGHGQYDDQGKLGWWVPVEALPRDPGTYITNASIRDYIQGMRARHVYLIADSCFSGTLLGSRSLPPFNDKFYAKLFAKRSRWGLTSGSTEPVQDRGKEGHSLFAYFLINLLKENNDSYLVPSQIYDRLAPMVANNVDQMPRSEPLKGTGDEGGQFVFRLASTARVAVPPPLEEAPTGRPSSADTAQNEELARIRQELESLRKQIPPTTPPRAQVEPAPLPPPVSQESPEPPQRPSRPGRPGAQKPPMIAKAPAYSPPPKSSGGPSGPKTTFEKAWEAFTHMALKEFGGTPMSDAKTGWLVTTWKISERCFGKPCERVRLTVDVKEKDPVRVVVTVQRQKTGAGSFYQTWTDDGRERGAEDYWLVMLRKAFEETGYAGAVEVYQ